jgi:hypothetical protein
MKDTTPKIPQRGRQLSPTHGEQTHDRFEDKRSATVDRLKMQSIADGSPRLALQRKVLSSTGIAGSVVQLAKRKHRDESDSDESDSEMEVEEEDSGSGSDADSESGEYSDSDSGGDSGMEEEVDDTDSASEADSDIDVSDGESDFEDDYQSTEWTAAKLERYKTHLRSRADTRIANGKNKRGDKLLRKLMKARRALDSDWVPKLADAPTAGHHVPPISISNSLKGDFKFGPRKSARELARDRLYLTGEKARRRAQHWMMHESEGIQGINRSGAFTGTGTINDDELAKRILLAHDGLRSRSKRPLKAIVMSQKARMNHGLDGKTPKKLADATRGILEAQLGYTLPEVESDRTDSEPESDESKWLSDSGSDADESQSDSDSD